MKWFCLPSAKGSTLKRKEFAPPRSKFFSFKLDSFSERAWCAGKQSGSLRCYLPCHKNLKSVPSPLKRYCDKKNKTFSVYLFQIEDLLTTMRNCADQDVMAHKMLFTVLSALLGETFLAGHFILNENILL